MMRILLVTLLASTVFASPVKVSPMVILDFVPIALSEDDRAMHQRYSSNPVNSHCNAVRFESERLLKLITDLNDGELTIEESIVFVRLPIGEPMSFVGTVFEGVDHHGKSGPFLWEGRLEGSDKYVASIVIEVTGRTRAYFTANQGMFRLAPAPTPSSYFLCQRNSKFLREGLGR